MGKLNIMKSSDRWYLALGFVMLLAGIRALITHRLASPLWSIQGGQAIASGILCVVLGATLVINAWKKRGRSFNKKNEEQ
jgi:surface polysaccharide O-acyltransferase-like enzyme